MRQDRGIDTTREETADEDPGTWGRRLPGLADGAAPVGAGHEVGGRRQLRAPQLRPRARRARAWCRSSRSSADRGAGARSPARSSAATSATSPTPMFTYQMIARLPARRDRALRGAARRAVLDDRPATTRSTRRSTTSSARSTCSTRSPRSTPPSTWSSSARWASTARRTSTSRRAGSRSPTRAARTACSTRSGRAPSTTCPRCTTATTSSSPAGSGACGPPT